MPLNKNESKEHSSTQKLDDYGIFKDSDACYSNQSKGKIEKFRNDTSKYQDNKLANIEGHLNKNEAIYLWNTLGDILTKSLLDIAKRQPENPIQCLTHSLLFYKYHKKSKDTPDLAKRLDPEREAVFKTTKTPRNEHHKKTAVDEDQEIHAFTSNITQQIIFDLFE